MLPQIPFSILGKGPGVRALFLEIFAGHQASAPRQTLINPSTLPLKVVGAVADLCYLDAMFDHELIEQHPYDSVPLNRDLYLMDEEWMQAYEEELLTLVRGGGHRHVGSVSPAAAREIKPEAIELSWYPNVLDRFHEVRVILPRSQFVVCTECWQWDEKPRIFVRSGWLAGLHLRAYSAFVLVDAIGMKEALAKGVVTRTKLIALRDKFDEISARSQSLSLISFGDSLLLKSNWFVGHRESELSYTYEPEAIIRCLPEINAAYQEILGMAVYAVITQGSNEYYDDGLLHFSPTRNHVSLNSLGLPFAQLFAIDKAAREAIHNGEHQPTEVYLEENFFRSLRFNLAFSRDKRSRYYYDAPLACGPSYYYAESLRKLLDNFESEEERSRLRKAISK
jgi:hypothetical protein